MIEIERKFLINKFPNLQCLVTADVLQGYISVNPEVRIRSYSDSVHKDYLLSIKGEGDLCRKEVETYIDEQRFNELVEMISKPLITKKYRLYALPNGLTLECVQVDAGSASEYFFAEIEFRTEAEALNYVPHECLGREVTYDSAYKLKNYWQATRYK